MGYRMNTKNKKYAPPGGEKTKADYLKLAAFFIEQRLDGKPPTPKRIAQALKECASEYRPAYWRKLRNALAYSQFANGYKKQALEVNLTVNPSTIDDDGKAKQGKPKQRRQKSIKDADADKIINAMRDKGDIKGAALATLCRYTGCRPAEAAGIVAVGGAVSITGVKKSEKLQRGADRTLFIEDDAIFQAVEQAVRDLDGMTGDKIENALERFRATAKAVFPKRKMHPSLYTFRHQIGANLKSDKSMSQKEVAYVMGHQSAESVKVYGRSQAGNGKSWLKMADGYSDPNVRRTIEQRPEFSKSVSQSKDSGFDMGM